MRIWLKSLSPPWRFCVDCALTLAFWAAWLVLGALLALQIGIATSHELAVPAFVLRAFEQRFDASGLHARFGRATFDPGGGVVLENLQLSLPDFTEPIAHARAVFVRLDPWLLLAGRFEARRVHGTGISVFVPAMLSPTGRSEEMLRDLDFTLEPGAQQLAIEHLSARAAGIIIDLRGAVQLPRPDPAAPVTPLPFLANFAHHYAEYSRQLIRAAARLAACEQPEIHASLTPSATRGAIARVTLHARAVHLPDVHGLQLTEVSLTTRLPLLGAAPAVTPFTLSVASLQTREGLVARDLAARVRGALRPAQLSYLPTSVELTAREISARGFTLRSLLADLAPPSPTQVDAALVAACAGSPIAARGRVDLAEQSATLHVTGAFAPALLEPIGALLGRDIRRFIGFGEPVELDADVRFAPGWKFAGLTGRVALRQIDAYHVPMDSAGGDIEFDGRRFIARHALATLGDNFARGSFEQDLATREFRFLLEGRLRPLAIGGWFHEWWPNFFEHFEFPTEAPDASVDVTGRWWSGHETSVFVFAQCTNPEIRGAKLDYARTLIYVRPNFLDGLEFFGTRGPGELRGTFRREVDTTRYEWKTMSLAFTSTIDLDTAKRLLGPGLASRVEPFTFEHPPSVRVTGQFEGPAAPGGEHHTLTIETQSTGAFSAYHFPAHNLSFDATLHDGDLELTRVAAEVAGGAITGKARLWGSEAQRRLGFDAVVRGANLGQAVNVVSSYAAHLRGTPAGANERFFQGKTDVSLDLALSAEGNFAELLSYHGSGNAQLAGAELGQVRMLGLLSELLNFTALRFTAARTEFKIEGPRLSFPVVNITGANSAIEAHGTYFLDRRELDFNARVYPFQESKSFLQSVVGAVLTPLSTALEVKLTGPLEQPSWAFVIGPTNLFRSLTQPDTPASPAAPAAPASPPPRAEPTASPPPPPAAPGSPSPDKTH